MVSMTYSFLAAAALLMSAASATKIHVKQGCILVGDKKLCGPKQNYVINNDGHVTIYGRFDAGNVYPTTHAGCKLDATWPSNYGDVYYGVDNCFYDSNGLNINGQCCTGGSGGDDVVNNPYAH